MLLFSSSWYCSIYYFYVPFYLSPFKDGKDQDFLIALFQAFDYSLKPLQLYNILLEIRVNSTVYRISNDAKPLIICSIFFIILLTGMEESIYFAVFLSPEGKVIVARAVVLSIRPTGWIQPTEPCHLPTGLHMGPEI